MSGDHNMNQSDQFTFSSKHLHLGFYKPPACVGYWVFPGSKKGYETKFSMTGKPNWFHRLMMKWLMGWVWEDVK